MDTPMTVQIEHADMVSSLAKDGSAIIQRLTPNSMHLMHMAVGIAGEAGELLEAIHGKRNFDEIDIGNVIEELGDAEFYLEGYRQGMVINRDETLGGAAATDYSKDYGADFAFSMAIFTELAMNTGRLLDDTKKFVIYCKPIDRSNVIANLILIENAMEGVRQSLGILYIETLEHNLKKLVKGDGVNKPRYEGGNYSDEAAQDRADKHI